MFVSDKLMDFLQNDRIQYYINNGEWDNLYKFNRKNEYFGISGELTQLLLKSGIDPLNSLDYIPGFYMYGSTITNFNIPNHIKEIREDAFSNSNINKIFIPNSVEYIGEGVFSDCKNLNNIQLPKNISFLNNIIFYSSGLKEIVIPGNIKEIKHRAFTNCSLLEKVTIEEGTNILESEIFLWCNSLNNITIPQSIYYIGHNIFDGCSKLKYINYNGTEDQWKRINIHSQQQKLFGSIRVKCIDAILKYNKQIESWEEI